MPDPQLTPETTADLLATLRSVRRALHTGQIGRAIRLCDEAFVGVDTLRADQGLAGGRGRTAREG